MLSFASWILPSKANPHRLDKGGFRDPPWHEGDQPDESTPSTAMMSAGELSFRARSAVKRRHGFVLRSLCRNAAKPLSVLGQPRRATGLARAGRRLDGTRGRGRGPARRYALHNAGLTNRRLLAVTGGGEVPEQRVVRIDVVDVLGRDELMPDEERGRGAPMGED